MKLSQIEMMCIWAAVTGLVLCALWFGALFLGFKTSETLPLLICGVGGFELFHFAQEMMLRHRRGV